jgi:cation transport ATPase
MNNIFTLKQWIVVATINLTPTAIASITKEITDHYQTSLEQYEVRGISRVEAESLAVRDLGLPKVAARGFEREYLTKDQARRFLPESKRSLWTKAVVSLAWIGLILFMLKSIAANQPTLSNVFNLFLTGISFFLCVGFLFDSASRQLLQRNRSVPLVILVIVVEYLTIAIGIAVWFLYAPVPFKIPPWTFLTLITFLTVGMAYTELPILRKLSTRASR